MSMGGLINEASYIHHISYMLDKDPYMLRLSICCHLATQEPEGRQEAMSPLKLALKTNIIWTRSQQKLINNADGTLLDLLSMTWCSRRYYLCYPLNEGPEQEL